MVCVLPGKASICPVVVLRSWDPPAFPITLTVFTPCWLGRLIIILNIRYRLHDDGTDT
jgi:hypothetical protein